MTRAQTAGVWRATDRLTGRVLGPLDQGLTLTIPAGTFRLVEINAAKQSPTGGK